jgi:NitT/TauT family transport system permease protein
LPYAAIGLVWNSMMSFGGGWFFLAASESISVLNHHIQLPGIGSYMATAMQQGNIPALLEAMSTMVVMIVVVDQLFWRPLVVWAQRFKLDTHADDPIESWFLKFLHRSRLALWISEHIFGSMLRAIDSTVVNFVKSSRHKQTHSSITPHSSAWKPWLSRGVALLGILLVFYYGFQGTVEIAKLGWPQIFHVIILGVFTLTRVMSSTVLALLWTVPVGVAIGLHPRASRITQPLVQIAASFPANMVFPLVTLVYLELHVNFQIGSLFLMMLGTQWYILFNVIAGAQAIPSDLKEATRVLGLRGWERWRRLLLPALFPYIVTGCITASGGAWNASIIAELVTWKQQTLVATGLGAYITQVTTLGDWPAIVLSIVVMAAFVTTVNRIVWRPLQKVAEKRFRII